MVSMVFNGSALHFADCSLPFTLRQRSSNEADLWKATFKNLFALVWQDFTFIAHALYFVDGLLSILLSQVLGLFHRLAQEFFKLSSE